MNETPVQLEGEFVTLRGYRPDDAEGLVAVANDPHVTRYLTHAFPQPYRLTDAEAWIALNERLAPTLHFSIVVDGTLAGGIGITPGDHERRGSAMLGYWLGTAYWGRGIASDAVCAIVPYAFATFRLHRLSANVMSPNSASARVLEKAGFEREAVLRRAIRSRDGAIHDELIYAIVDPTAVGRRAT